MTQKERIDQLEREVTDLRALVGALQAQITARPFEPYKPLPQPQRWPNYPPPWPPNGPIYHGSCTINTPPNGDLIVMNT
jgi:hypothetical protein